MDIDLHSYVVNELRARGRAQWAAIALASGVPESTVQKIAYGVTTNPGVSTVQSLANALMHGAADPPQQVAHHGPERRRQMG